MSQIASKNLYELLGNDLELDPDRAPEPPTKAIDKPVARLGKRNGAAEGPNGDRAAGRQQNARGEQAGTTNSRSEQRDDGLRQDRHRDRAREPRDHRNAERGRGQRARGRGGRNDYGGTRNARNDRRSHDVVGDHDKQAAHGWGGEGADAELNDEQAGDAMAAAELKSEGNKATGADGNDPAVGSGPDLAGEDGAVAEVEDRTKSYDQYLAEQAEKRLALSGSLEIRKANEGSKQKFPSAKAHERNPDEENYFAGAGGKARREKETKQKNVLTVDGQYYAPPDSGDRGRGGRGRGGRGRGEGRGEFRGRAGRGRGESRGNHRGDGPRGGRAGFNANDQSAFPALGGY